MAPHTHVPDALADFRAGSPSSCRRPSPVLRRGPSAVLLCAGALAAWISTPLSASEAAASLEHDSLHAPALDLPAPAVLTAAAASSEPSVLWTNQAAQECIDGATLAFLAAYPSTLIPSPLEYPAEVTTYLANLALKDCAPVLEIPADIAVAPNVTNERGEACWRDFEAPPQSGKWESIVGLQILDDWPARWGGFGAPEVYHFNSQAIVTADAPGERIAAPGSTATQRVPVGSSGVLWTAATDLSILDFAFVPIPGPVDRFSQKHFWRELVLALGKEVLLEIAKEAALSELDDVESVNDLLSLPNPGAIQQHVQNVVVWDDSAPVLQNSQPVFVLEADVPGGARRLEHLSALYATLTARDACDRQTDVTYRGLPEFLLVDHDYDVVWTATDRGPSRDGERNRSPELHQLVRIVDTRPPIVVPPPDRVLLSDQPLTAVDLGAPQVFDLVDLAPTIANDAPQSFPMGESVVRWTATDQSGNVSAPAFQTVLVKSSNLPPEAVPQTGSEAASARTFEPIEIVLEGFDPDGDPLHFELESQPANGFFHSPLFPTFIEDYRVEANVSPEEMRDRCEPQGGVTPSGHFHIEFPWDASFVEVADDGTTYVLDEGWLRCDFGHLDSAGRLAIFDAEGRLARNGDGEPLALQLDPRPRGIHVDQEDRTILITDHTSGGTGTVLVFDFELEPIARFRTDVGDVPPGENPLTNPTRSIIDSERGILYVTDRSVVRAYRSDRHVTGGLADEPVLLGSLYRGAAGNIVDLALDSAGALYVSAFDRVLKFAPSAFTGDGSFVPGHLIGWLGRCDRDLAAEATQGEVAACDEENHRSIGFSCTEATCAVDGATWGDAPGQLDEPRGMAIDPNDVLYVTDYENGRVQRFTTEGYFAGEARSACGGSCFVLGDFGKPEDITVNSTHFYILDRETDLLHVSETTPLTPLDRTRAKLLYQSDDGFQGVDSFRFRATDGLERSAPESVEIRVTRNQRPPVALPVEATTPEDTPVALVLRGEDPDGALDALSFTVVEPPSQGGLEGSGAQRTFVPAPDFTGTVTFRYTVGDGAFTSEPATASIEVLAVDDAPRLAELAPREAGRGFPITTALGFTDPDQGDRHTVRASWSDGEVAEEQSLADAGETAEGPFLSEGLAGQGTVVATHTFSQTGSHDVELCVSDRVEVASDVKRRTARSQTTCRQVAISVSERVDLVLASSLETAEIAAGEPLAYRLTVTNARPTGFAGLAATGVELVDRLPAGVAFESATTDDGGCRFESGSVRCTLRDLAPGAAAAVDVVVVPQRPGELVLSDAEVVAEQPEALPDTNRQRVPMTVVGAGGPSPHCSDSEQALCLHGGRFRLEVAWRDAEDRRGAATVVPGGSSDSGMFWFFTPDNWEMLVKVLDGCSINDHFWVLAAATTDVEYELTVTDTAAGTSRVYTNPLATASPAVIDVEAFATCGAGSSASPVARDLAAARTGLGAWAAHRAQALAACDGGSDEALCLAGGRFRVEVAWRDATGNTGSAHVVPFGSASSGLLWFFAPDNWEMMVKVLDACAVNDRFWVFAAATTDVEYTLTVTDVETGEEQRYFNPLGQAAAALTDTGAFATCP